MKLHTTDNPARAAGEHISKEISEHNGDTVCLLSGGSALEVIKHITITRSHQSSTGKHPQREDTERGPAKSCSIGETLEECRTMESTSSRIVYDDVSLRECRTIFMMVDERVSGEAEINNFLQLVERYPDFVKNQEVVDTTPMSSESIEDYARRIEKTFFKKISELNNPKIITLLGMGRDGHTAGIFPLTEDRFKETYPDDGTYVPVYLEGLTIDSRASFTPSWLLDHSDQLVAFIAGDSKREILDSLINESKELHERPAELMKLHKDAHVYTDQHIEPAQVRD